MQFLRRLSLHPSHLESSRAAHLAPLASILLVGWWTSASGQAVTPSRVPLLWQTETTSGYLVAGAVASGEGRIATVGEDYTNCGAGICGNAMVRVQDLRSGALLWSANQDAGLSYTSNNAVAISDHMVVTAGFSYVVDSGHIWWVASGYSLETGKLLWRDVLGDASTDYYPWQIVVKEGRAYVTGIAGTTCATLDSTTCDQFTRVYEVVSGAVVSSLRDDPSAGGDDESLSIALTGHLMFTGGNVGGGPGDATAFSVRAYDARTRELVWNDTIADADQDGYVTKVAAHGDRVVAVGSVNDDWMVRCYDAGSGTVRWSQTYSLLDQSIAGVYDSPIQVAMDDATVVVAGYGSTKLIADELYPKASRDWVVRAYDAETGRLLWSDHSGSPTDTDEANAGVVLVDGRAYALGFLADAQGAPHTLLRAYDARSGRVVWDDELSRMGFPSGVTITLAASEGRLTAASYVRGTRPPDATGVDLNYVNLLVRTYQIADDGREHWDGN
jgi:hypothetical protein